jgi:AcrR family transcriptional regulator
MSETETLSPEKRKQILAGAAAVFARDGYEGASVARIAAEAGVSKGTLYNYFESKADMFIAWVRDECSHRLRGVFCEDAEEEDLAAALRGLGMRVIGMMLSEVGETIYRVVVSEAGKFPDLPRAFYEAGPRRMIARLAERLARETQRGRLAIDDADFAAEQFFSLCQTRIVMRRKLHLREDVTEEAMARVVDAAVRMFLNTYAADPPAGAASV